MTIKPLADRILIKMEEDVYKRQGIITFKVTPCWRTADGFTVWAKLCFAALRTFCQRHNTLKVTPCWRTADGILL